MEREDLHVEQQGDYKNALPREVDDHPVSDAPRQLRTQNENDAPLSRAEADVAGISETPSVIYGESDENQNAEDVADAHRGPAA